jgi:hypothetical protein
MTLDQLVQWLKSLHIEKAEDRTHADGKRVIIFTAHIPFPLNRPVWYTLVLDPEQTTVSRREVEALLHHCWHAEQEMPKFPAATTGLGPTSTAMNAIKRSKAS